MKILAIDTTSQVINIALFSGEKLTSIERDVKYGGYEDVLSLIKAVLNKSKIKLETIDCFGVCNGPGSFTGMRIGLSAVKALAYSLNKPVVSYKSLDLLAWMVKDGFLGLLCVMQDARRGNIYSAVYSNRIKFKRISEYALTDITKLLSQLKKINKKPFNLYFYGDAVLNYKDKIKSSFPDCKIIKEYDARSKSRAMISLARNNTSKKLNSFEILPFYMYPDNCQVTKPKK
ncbi:MAG: tRNA (adenosine(37)-N6)-threonylcarbamoyltransferase complex dimerization subunit type 1 TsaB [Candidatus Omnitrophica bacterium]|nr:tRNA (adenosine(37)-N6)-threonylcarbamoyltransferase complex dimerization subunit type 1 TsaB [Candidatus Omnitrophota bacterium]